MKNQYFSLFFLLISFCIYSQDTTAVDFKRLAAQLEISPSKQEVSGEVTLYFDVLQHIDSIFIDARKMQINNVRLNGAKADFFNDETRIGIIADFKKSKGNILKFNYTAYPKQAMYFVGWKDAENLPEIAKNQVWTQGQGKYTSNWLPSFDDPNEKLEFDLSIKFNKAYRVISNGELVEKLPVNDSVVQWNFNMKHPMSSYLVALAAGNYVQKVKFSKSKVPLYFFFYPGQKELIEPTYRHSVEIFNFLEAEIGVPYPWQNYKQIPVRDFLYSGMENTGTTIFSDMFITDSAGFKDRNYIMVNAHELAHQWFGNMVTAVSGKHHWLQEGFAAYYALLAEKEIFGEDYFYYKLFEIAEDLKERSDAGKGQPVLTTSGNSLTYYHKGAWALHFLREKIGAKAFRKGIQNYLNNYKFENVSTADFIAEMEKASGQVLSEYVSNWLKQSSFQGYAALNLLKQSDFITDYLAIAALRKIPIPEKKETLEAALDFPVNDYIGQEVVYQLALEDPGQVSSLYEKAFATNNIFVRQAIASSLDTISPRLKSEYESLLQDKSYLTKEIALYKLWLNFPESRTQYLDELKGVDGFYDKNIRILWLALNLATPNYEPELKQSVYNELAGFTEEYYPFQIRQNAFNYLYQLKAFNDASLLNLLAATQHPASRFRHFSRDILKKILLQEEIKMRLMDLANSLPKKQQDYLKMLLDNKDPQKE